MLEMILRTLDKFRNI